MADNIIIDEKELVTLVEVPLDIIDPNHRSITPEMRRKILAQRFRNQLYADGIETGHLEEVNGKVTFRSKLTLPSFAGFVFEAYLVSKLNDNKKMGQAAFTWCTQRSRLALSSVYDQYKAIGTGFISTHQLHPHLYAPHSSSDIRFVRKNPQGGVIETALIHGTHNIAGIQVKAIKGNLKSQIIDPLLRGQYSHVITLLRDYYGTPTRTVCLRWINFGVRDGSITSLQREFLEDRIKGPEFLGIDQRDIDDYYDYIEDYHNGYCLPDKSISDATFSEIKRYKDHNGLLVPDDVGTEI